MKSPWSVARDFFEWQRRELETGPFGSRETALKEFEIDSEILKVVRSVAPVMPVDAVQQNANREDHGAIRECARPTVKHHKMAALLLHRLLAGC
jgi:hypothetical protein